MYNLPNKQDRFDNIYYMKMDLVPHSFPPEVETHTIEVETLHPRRIKGFVLLISFAENLPAVSWKEKIIFLTLHYRRLTSDSDGGKMQLILC